MLVIPLDSPSGSWLLVMAQLLYNLLLSDQQLAMSVQVPMQILSWIQVSLPEYRSRRPFPESGRVVLKLNEYLVSMSWLSLFCSKLN